MEYPQDLLNEVSEKTKSFQLEGFLGGKGPLDAVAMLVGEAPGQTELISRIPFSGQAGKELDMELKQVNLSRSDIYITSSVRRRPFKIKSKVDKTGKTINSYPNRTPTKAEVKASAPLLDYEIQTIRPKIIAPMGNIALQRLLGNAYTISTYHGQLLESPIYKISDDRSRYEKTEESYLIFPIYHPAAVLYKRFLKETVSTDWQTLVKLIREHTDKE